MVFWSDQHPWNSKRETIHRRMETTEMTWITLPQIKRCPILHPSTIGMYFVKKSLKNQNQEVNLWKNLKPTSSWLNKWLDKLRLGIWRHKNEKRGYSPSRSVKQKLLTLQGRVNPLLHGNNDGLSFEGNSFCVLLLSRFIFEIRFFQELFLIVNQWLLVFLLCY